ncbi:MAG: glycosyltransferase [Aquihabitans sp.]
MRILFLAWRDLANKLAGGSEVLIDTLATGLAERGHDVTLMAANPTEPRAYRVHPNGGTVSQYARAPLSYLRHFRDADLVVDVANGLSFYSPLWRRKPSICLVNHLHTDQWEQWFPKPMAAVGNALEQRAMPAAYRNRLFVAVSPSTADGLEAIGVDRSRIRIIINGTHLPDEVGTESDEPLFIGLSRLVPHKRFELAIQAWEKVRPHVGGRLVIAGQGPEHSKLVAAAGPGVELPGRISEAEKQRLLSSAWLMVHPASHEGWGLVITEAAAYGTPSLAFRVPGLRDSVVDGMSGILIDRVEDLAPTWQRIAEDPALRARLRIGARKRAEACTWTSTVDRFEEICEEAIGDSQRRLRLPNNTWSKNHHEAPVLDEAPTLEKTGLPVGTGRQALRVVRDRPALTIVLPAYNEAARLPVSLPILLDHVSQRSETTEILLVDDGSSDETVRVANELLRTVPRAGVLRLGRHLGKGAAVRSGVAHASGHQIMFMDADMATDLDYLDPLLSALDHTQVAIGSRGAPGAVTNGLTPTSDATHRAFNHLARTTTGLELMDFQCGFKAFRGPSAKLLFHLLYEKGYAFDVELLATADQIGYGVTEVPVHWKAVRGSHVRIVVDSAAMAFQIARIGRRARGGQSLASLQASSVLVNDVDLIAAQIREHLPISAPVIPWHEGALAMLPFVEPIDTEELAAELRTHLQEFTIQSRLLDTGLIFHEREARLRTALAAN